MKILLAVHHFPPRYTGGAELRTLRTAKALQARGHAVSVVCVERIDAPCGGEVAWQDDTYDGVAVQRLSFDLAAAPDPDRWEYDNPWLGRHLRQRFDTDRPDVFHVIGGYLWSGRALRVARDVGVPTVLTLTDFWFLCRRITLLRSSGDLSAPPIDAGRCARCLAEESRRYRWLGRVAPAVMDFYWSRQRHAVERVQGRLTFLRETLDDVNAIISPSLFLRSTFVDAGFPAGRIRFSRQGHDGPPRGDRPPRQTAGALRVGYLGQIAHLKGVHVLIEAVRRQPSLPVSVRIYGDVAAFPDYTADLRRRIGADHRITLAGVAGKDHLGAIHRELDVIVVPSLWYENSPNVILEAQLHRTPVIGSNLGGVAELIADGRNGLLFPPGDAGALAARLRAVVQDPSLVSRLRAGIEPVRSVAAEITELESIYRQVVGAAAPAATGMPRLS